MVAKRILLVGCGDMGSRHLQGLVKLTEHTIIEIVEPNKNAQRVAKSRLSEMPSNKSRHELVWHETANELKTVSDLVLITTKATGRVVLINKLLELGHSRFLVEKMVCQSADEYDLLLSRMKSSNAKGWVNTPRRYYEPYGDIRELLDQESEPIHLSANAGNEGLGTNAIHFIDLFSWLTGDYKIRLNGEFLFNKTFPNKRGKDLLEFAGTIIGNTKNESVLTLSFLPHDYMPLIVSISGKDKNFIIDETHAKVFAIKDPHDSHLKFTSEYQSNLTNKIAYDILENDHCIFPTINDSYFAHTELFRIFNLHLKKLFHEERRLCPIT